MLRGWAAIVALAGCGRFIDEDGDLWPPPDTGWTAERETPEGFDPCPRLVVETPFALSSSAAGTSDPRIAWSQDAGQFMVVWREAALGTEGEVTGHHLAFQRLDEDGQPVGLQQIAREADLVTPADSDSDPAVLAVPGMQHAPFLVTVQRGERLSVERILEGEASLQRSAVLTRALRAPPDSALRIPALSSDGERVAIGYLTTDSLVRLVALDVDPQRGPRCAHENAELDPPECADATVGLADAAAIGWLPPSAAGEDLAAYDAGGPVPWMAVRLEQSRTLFWMGLHPPAEGDAAMVEFAPTPHLTGPNDYVAGPRIASANRRFALAVRREASGAEAWQVANDGTVACVVAAPELAAGTPAVVWGHGRRLAVAGLVARGGGTDVHLVRADAPATEEARAAAVGVPCPAPLDEGHRLTRTEHVRARDPDLAFSGGGFGVVWAQSPSEGAPAEVWFAHARCGG